MTLARFAAAMTEFERRVQAIRPDQWQDPTPCTEWDVRALVDHLVTELLWAPLLLDGATIEDVGDRFNGDQLGADPMAAWRVPQPRRGRRSRPRVRCGTPSSCPTGADPLTDTAKRWPWT